jgi:hypothetical protein
MPFYALRWDAKDSSQLEALATKKAYENNITEMLASTNKISDLLSKDKLSKLYDFSKDLYKEGIGTFKSARENAKMTGKLLAHFLVASRHEVFGDHTFSLLGFSLGSQVVKSTVNRLSKLGATDLIHNVYFLAGATFTKGPKLDE